MASLTAAEVRSYHDNGFVGPFSAWGPRDLDNRWPAILDVVIGRPSVCYGVYTSRDRHLDSRTIQELCTSSEIVDRVACILSEALLLWRSVMFVKPAGGEPIFPHRDYPSPGPLAIPAHSENVGVTAWLALTETTKENGCLYVVPRSNRRSRPGRKSVERKYIGLKPGQFILYDVNTIHGSGPNTTAAQRAGLSIRFSPVRVKLYPDHPHRVVPVPKNPIRIDGGAFDIRRWRALIVHGGRVPGPNPIGVPPRRDNYYQESIERLVESGLEWMNIAEQFASIPCTDAPWVEAWFLRHGDLLKESFTRASRIVESIDCLAAARSIHLILDALRGTNGRMSRSSFYRQVNKIAPLFSRIMHVE